MPSIEAQLKNLLKDKKALADLKFDNGKTLGEALKSEGERLKEILANEIKGYYNAYDPKVYIRNESKSLDKMLRINVNQADNTIEIYFDSSMAWGKSIFPNGKDGYIPLLIDQGWEVKKDVWFKTWNHFGHYEGYGFIEKAIRRFESSNPYKLKIAAFGEYGGRKIDVYNKM